MKWFIPTIYQKDIFSIPYKKLKKLGIQCLVFDLDNTLGLIDHHTCPPETKELLNQLKEEFYLVISSNNTKKRIQPYIDELNIMGCSCSMKPLPFGLHRIRKKYQLEKSQMIMIGDQMVTDILSGQLFGIKTILVDPMGTKDLKITGLNRKIEEKIIKHYQKTNEFERGKYYE